MLCAMCAVKRFSRVCCHEELACDMSAVKRVGECYVESWGGLSMLR